MYLQRRLAFITELAVILLMMWFAGRKISLLGISGDDVAGNVAGRRAQGPVLCHFFALNTSPFDVAGRIPRQRTSQGYDVRALLIFRIRHREKLNPLSW